VACTNRGRLTRAVLLAIAVVLAAAATPQQQPAWIGMGFSYHRAATPGSSPWLYVQGVIPNGPAYQAGVRPQDVITAIDGNAIAFADFAQALGFFVDLAPGRELELSIVRQNRKLVMRVKAVPLPYKYRKVWEANREFARRRAKP